MRIVAEYQNNAGACRKLAKLLFEPDDKKALAMMASSWEKLAKERERDLVAEEE